MATAARRSALLLFFLEGAAAALGLVGYACGLDVTGSRALGGDDGGAEAGDRAHDADGSTSPPPSPAPDDGGANDASRDAEAGPPCPADMIDSDAGFCIDRTEVTQAAYAVFLASAAGASGTMSGACSFKTTHLPADAGMLSEVCQWDPAAHAARPVVCADWCDAKAYCEWAGKRLCGRIGGGSVPFTSLEQDAAVDEWYFACSRGGARVYAYGDTFDSAKCKDDGIRPPDDVATNAACVGGLDGLYDMTGNVLEWEDSCNGDAAVGDRCRVRGGSWFFTNGNDERCDAIPNGAGKFDLTRSERYDDTGFRCCKDAR